MTTKKSNTNLKLTSAKLADSIIKGKKKPETLSVLFDVVEATPKDVVCHSPITGNFMVISRTQFNTLDAAQPVLTCALDGCKNRALYCTDHFYAAQPKTYEDCPADVETCLENLRNIKAKARAEGMAQGKKDYEKKLIKVLDTTEDDWLRGEITALIQDEMWKKKEAQKEGTK